MKLYDYPGAPNPRRVKIFAEEKNLNLFEILNFYFFANVKLLTKDVYK